MVVWNIIFRFFILEYDGELFDGWHLECSLAVGVRGAHLRASRAEFLASGVFLDHFADFEGVEWVFQAVEAVELEHGSDERIVEYELFFLLGERCRFLEQHGKQELQLAVGFGLFGGLLRALEVLPVPECGVPVGKREPGFHLPAGHRIVVVEAPCAVCGLAELRGVLYGFVFACRAVSNVCAGVLPGALDRHDAVVILDSHGIFCVHDKGDAHGKTPACFIAAFGLEEHQAVADAVEPVNLVDDEGQVAVHERFKVPFFDFHDIFHGVYLTNCQDCGALLAPKSFKWSQSLPK